MQLSNYSAEIPLVIALMRSLNKFKEISTQYIILDSVASSSTAFPYGALTTQFTSMKSNEFKKDSQECYMENFTIHPNPTRPDY